MNGWLAAAVGFLIGSIPFGLLLTKGAGLGDIRAIGSGNIGATNVLRTGRRDLAAATLLLDGVKGTVAVLLGGPVAGLFAVLGHCLTPWLRFRGGKGVATGLGVMFGLSVPLGLACCAVWLGATWLSKRSSVGGLSAMVAAPFLAIMVQPYAYVLPLLCFFIVVRHRSNIARLRAGTEPKVGQR